MKILARCIFCNETPFWKSNMRSSLIIACCLIFLSLQARSQGDSIQSYEPEITLFESVDTVRQFMTTETEFHYSDRNLVEVSLKMIDGHPRKGEAWVYRFTHQIPKRGDDLSIFHYTDGQIIEFSHGQ